MSTRALPSQSHSFYHLYSPGVPRTDSCLPPVSHIPAAAASSPPPPEPVKEETPADDWFGGWGTGKKDSKKDKKKAIEFPGFGDSTADADKEELQPAAVDEPKGDDDWSTGTKKKDKKKDSKSKGIIEVTDASPDASVLLPESVQEDPWASWTTGKKTKKSSKMRLLKTLLQRHMVVCRHNYTQTVHSA